MTTTLNDIINTVQTELYELIAGGGIGVNNIWFGDIDPADTQTPAVHFMLESFEQNDLQVVQTSSRIGLNLNYTVSCLYAGSEGEQTTEYAREFVNGVYDLLQGQHDPDKRLNGNVFGINCESGEYGFVVLDLPEEVFMNGGVIRLTIQIFEDR